MKKGFSPIIIVLAVVALSGVFLVKDYLVKDTNPRDTEISQLKEQISILQAQSRRPATPIPKPTPENLRWLVLNTNDITSKNTYTLDCWTGDNIPDNSIIKSIKSQLSSKDILTDVCVNNELAKTLFLVSTQKGKFLKMFNQKTQSIKTIINASGGGICETQIYLWARENWGNNYVYIKHFACDGNTYGPFEAINQINISGF